MEAVLLSEVVLFSEVVFFLEVVLFLKVKNVLPQPLQNSEVCDLKACSLWLCCSIVHSLLRGSCY